MLEVNYWIIPVAALIPMFAGFIWYNPKVIGTAWMKEAGMTEEKMQGANMALIFGLSYIFALMLASAMLQLTIHQFGFQSLVLEKGGEFSEAGASLFSQVMELYGDSYRTFGHGAFHGTIGGLFIAFPILATNAMFERKSWKYIWINTGYWVITMALMGGLVCQMA